MPTCRAKLRDGKRCPKAVKLGQSYCRWHDPEDESWREMYEHLEKSSPKEKTDIVLGLIEEHPEHRLVLPTRNGLVANLKEVDLSPETLEKKRKQSGIGVPPWWSAHNNGANLQYADLQGVYLSGANLRSADLSNANLQNAFLIGANLQDAHLTDVNLQGAYLIGANLQSALLLCTKLQGVHPIDAQLKGAYLDWAELQGVDLVRVKDMSSVHGIGNAWLDRTKIRLEKLGGAIGEEQKGDFLLAKRGYYALKRNYYDLGDYDAASWVYRKERRMEKLEARQKGRSALSKRRWSEAAADYFKYVSDLIVEWLCDYGESVWRVIGWMAVLLFIAGPLLFSLIGGIVWNNELLDEYFELANSWQRFWYAYRLYLLYTLDVFTTASFSGLQPSTDAVKLASGFFAIAGIFLAGLLGFVAGNRIRRS